MSMFPFAACAGKAIFTVALAATASTAALADQNVEVGDNASVDCTASARELTRVSLIGDEFASVSKVQSENPLDDFDVVNEPTRGDIYISVPHGFRPKALSFFGTSKKGFVYKFACKVLPVGAQQIFLANRAVDAKVSAPGGDDPAPDSAETAVRLIQAMASEASVPGYAVRPARLEPVAAGSLSAVLLTEYTGLDLVGRVIRIRNTGPKAQTITSGMVAPAHSVAVHIARPELPPREETAAYVVMHKEGVAPQ